MYHVPCIESWVHIDCILVSRLTIRPAMRHGDEDTCSSQMMLLSRYESSNEKLMLLPWHAPRPSSHR
jgi:hypothetical protein